MAWIALFVAGVLEVVWAAAMKQSDGFTRPGPTIITIVAAVLSFALLGWSIRTLPLGMAYMLWTGIGAIGAFAVGILFMGEGASVMRMLAASLIVGGLFLMKAASPA